MYAGSQYCQLDPYRVMGPAPLRALDILVESRSPARPQHPLRGLVSLRHHHTLRAHPPLWQHPRSDPCDLRHVCLGAYLANARAGRLGLVAMVITVLGSALFLPAIGVSTFAAPEEGQAHLAGIEGIPEMPTSFADTSFAATSLLVVLLLFVGNVLLGVAVWRSGTLPRWAGALWAAAAVLMYPFGLVYAATIGPQSTPPTVLVGAVMVVVGGGVDGLERPAPSFEPARGRSPAQSTVTPAERTSENTSSRQLAE